MAQQKDEHAFPIDIHYNKLLDWLIDRRHCDLKWLPQVKQVKERVTKALRGLPDSNKLAGIVQHESIGYLQCVEIFEVLKLVEGDAKNLFGQYSSLLLREWADIIKQYQKGNAYLAECAQYLMRCVKYEIPALKQQIAKCQQTQKECLRKEGECEASGATLRDKFSSSCKEMGIAGEAVKEELSHLVSELPGVFDQVIAELPKLLSAILYYQAFVQHTTNRVPGHNDFLPVLSFVLKEGNVTVYQWRHGKPPQELEHRNQDTVEQEPDMGNGIDWGDEGLAGTVPEGERGTEIDFGSEQLDIETVDLTCITVEDSGEMQETEPSRSRETGTTAVGDPELQSVLENTRTRNLFLDDVMELKEFLEQRCRELSSEGNLLVSQFDSDQEALGVQSSDSITTLLTPVERLLHHLTNPRTQHLFLIKSSPRYLDRLADSLLHQLQLACRADAQAQAHTARRIEAETTAQELGPRLSAIVTETKQLQSMIEAEISKRYNNRVVNIMGEINQI